MNDRVPSGDHQSQPASESSDETGVSKEPRVVLDNLTKRYGDFLAVDHLDVDIPGGVVFGVLGPNGAGKTTTLRMITGLLEPSEGRITIDGYDTSEQPVEARRITGFIPDRPYIYDKLTAFEYLRFIGGLYEMPADKVADRIDTLLELFELRPWGDRLIESFSHGMKQRLVFAGAMLPEPRLMVIDEPMVGLDPQGHRLVKRLFRQLADEEDTTILLSTHTLEVAEEVCDDILIINHGERIARGSLDTLRQRTGDQRARLEDVFLTLTEETDDERSRAVAERFGREVDA